ncbi:MAG TPA: HK97 family phage prohead protease [Puia sp.]|jgi:hypothetical protein|nr:HK97 family phage prohead protease [Puia sp.]
MIYEIKNLSGGIEDIDIKSNKVVGYASTFGNVDSDLDLVMPGAFTKSLADPGKRQLHLYMHDSYRPLSSVKGGSLKLEEDAKGLKFESQIVDTTWGKDVAKLIEAKVLNENSIGFMTVRAKETKAYRELHELKLFEVSSVSFGSNDQALNTKSLQTSLYTDDFLTARLETVTKALRNGTFTDDTFSQLEIYLYQLNQLLIESKSTKPAVQAAAKPVIDEKVIQRITAWNSLFKPQAKAIDPSQALAGRLLTSFQKQV